MPHDDLMDLKAERDDLKMRGVGKKKTMPDRRRVDERHENNSNARFILLMFVVLILMVAIGVMTFWLTDQFSQMDKKFSRVNQQLSMLSQRVDRLEGRLDTSNDTMLTSETTIKIKIKEHESEIRKLWGVAYDKNRKTIQTNEAALKSLMVGSWKITSDVKKLNILLKNKGNQIKALESHLVSQMKSLETNLVSQVDVVESNSNDQINDQAALLKALLSDMSGLQNKTGQIGSLAAANERSVAEFLKKIKSVDDELVRSVTDLQLKVQSESNNSGKELSKVKTLLNAIDKNRSRVNSELINLAKRVNELQKIQLKAN